MNDALVLTSAVHSEAGNPSREIRMGAIIAAAFFLLFLGWAAFVPLDAGVHAGGTIAVAGNRQTVQHKDGGVVTAIHVREGQHVRAGEVLIELSAPELKAAERALTSDYLTLLAQRARLLAERTGQRDFSPPAEFATLSPDNREIASEVMQLQRSEMHARSGLDLCPAIGPWATRGAAGPAAVRLHATACIAHRTAEADSRRARWSSQDSREGLRVDEPRP